MAQFEQDLDKLYEEYKPYGKFMIKDAEEMLYYIWKLGYDRAFKDKAFEEGLNKYSEAMENLAK